MSDDTAAHAEPGAEAEELDLDALRAACTRFLTPQGRRNPADVLAELADDAEIDTYGSGGVVSRVEEEVAELLGFESALFLPSGTMAQQIALRIHADRTGRRTVAWHPTSHLALHELDAALRLHGLAARPLGNPRRLFTLDDLSEIAEPLAAVLFEVPQREIGGRLPQWEDLCAQVAAVRERGARAHLDGARLWEAAAGYGREPAEIAGLFDTVYVSFYKGLGGLAGCALLGDADTVAEAREWRARHGGTLIALWPYAAAARAGLRLRLPRMPEYLEHAQAIAAALASIPEVEVVPNPPQTSMMHLYLRADADALHGALRRLAAEEKIWAWRTTSPSDLPSWQVVELSVGDATLEWSPAEVAALVQRLISQAQADRGGT